jgi:hypothetical protein
MTFHIGSQTGGVINNVEGDQLITGSQQGMVVTGEDARRALGNLYHAVTSAGLDEATAAQAHARLADMEAAMRTTPPDQPRFARALERLTRLLAAAGSLATAGAALVSPLHALAAWLGAIGQPIIRLLPPLS